MTRNARWLCLVLALAPSLVGCGLGGEQVTRVYTGREVAGPYITPEAYAHYAQGVIDESQGNLAKATHEYETALLDDDSSPDVWTRLGAVLCRAGKDPAAAFSEAEALDPEYAPLWRERARCALERGDARRALTLAERAVALDPEDESASLCVANAHQKLGRPADARRWLLGFLLRDPTSVAVGNAYRAYAPHPATPPQPPADLLGARRPGDRRATLEDVDRALTQGDSERARRSARGAGLGPSQLALRAAALGASQVARTETARILEADPDDSDALVAALTAATLDGDQAAYEAALRQLGREPLEPSALGVRLLGELLSRRVGPAAAKAWREAWALPKASDRLEAAVEQRASAQ